MNLKEIIYGSEEHKATIALRNKILRDPIGLVFSEQDLKDEENAYHVGCFSWKSGELMGCCFLTPHTDITIKLRQMAVDSSYQHMGIGGKVITFAEELAKEKGFEYVYLHARKEAVGFYQKYGYTLESDEFIEVGIPHFEMIKKI
jgi:predicted GNAT family N-acyltransferase